MMCNRHIHTGKWYIYVFCWGVRTSKLKILGLILLAALKIKWFEPSGISNLFGVIVQVRVVLRKTVVGD